MTEVLQSNEVYSVYCLLFPNGKMYIGITSKSPEERWHNGHGYHHSQVMTRAIKKYGWNNVEKEVLLSGLTKDEAIAIKIGLIKQYQLTNHDHGYNTSLGGELGPTLDIADDLLKLWDQGLSCTEIANVTHHDRHVVTRILKENGIPTEDIQARRWDTIISKAKDRGQQVQTQRQAEVMALWNDGYAPCEIRVMLNLHQNAVYVSLRACGISTKEMSVRTNEKYLRNEVPSAGCVPLRVNQYQKDGSYICSFLSIKEASSATGIGAPAIRASINGHCKTAGGYRWRYDNGDTSDLSELVYKNKKTFIVQCSLDDVRLGTHDSISAATEFLHKKQTSMIGQALRGKTKTAYGFKWKRIEYDKNIPVVPCTFLKRR